MAATSPSQCEGKMTKNERKKKAKIMNKQFGYIYAILEDGMSLESKRITNNVTI